MKRTTFIYVTLFLLPTFGRVGVGFCQDIHFSQFDASPLSLNPALTGVMELSYRFAGNYRNQWSSVAHPYSTTSFAYDMNLLRREEKKTYFGFGGSFYNDMAGKSKLGTNQLNVAFSSIVTLDENNTLSAGLMGGYGMRSITFTDLAWDSQYNGEYYDPARPTGEVNYSARKNYFDISAGTAWSYTKQKGFKSNMGVAYFHANRPNRSFHESREDNIEAKLVAHGSAEFKLRTLDQFPDRYIVPKLLYMRQGTQQLLYMGTFLKFVIQTASKYTNWRNEMSFDIGGFYRHNDAFIFATNFDYGTLKFGMSYDVNISKLRTASTYQGGIEFSLIFTNLFRNSLIKVR